MCEAEGHPDSFGCPLLRPHMARAFCRRNAVLILIEKEGGWIVSRLVFDSDMPKICVPLVCQTEGDIVCAGKELAVCAADLIEWRADFFPALTDNETLKRVLRRLRESLDDMPLLFTIRTVCEGGEIALSFEEYAAILRSVAETGLVDYIDVEMFWGYRDNGNQTAFPGGCIPQEAAADSCHDAVRNLVQDLREQVDVIGSYHDFGKTPPSAEITGRLLVMERLGASIPKMAVMPHTRQDVLDLMCATLRAKEALPDTPLITMSMGKLGAISRVAGASFGSAVTFGCQGRASAPGQIAVEQLRDMLPCFQ